MHAHINDFIHIRKYTSLYNQVIRAHVFIVKCTHYSRRITPLILPQRVTTRTHIMCSSVEGIVPIFDCDCIDSYIDAQAMCC